MPRHVFLRRLLYVLACLLPVWAVVAYFTGGVGWMIGPLRLSSRQPLRPVLIGAILFGWYVWRHPRDERDEDGRWMLRVLQPAIPIAVAMAGLAALYVGLHYGSFAAAGSDSYGYVSQARLWLNGSLRLAQPWVEQFSWPDREWMFSPLGYRPLGTDGTIVPTYPPGLSILMALFSTVFGGENGPFFVAPVCGAAIVWLTYALGKEATGSSGAGATAAALLAASPAFLNHVMAPMSDVPAAAGWALVALLLLKGDGRHYVSAAGLVAGLTLLIRPNLFLLALMPMLLWRPWEKKQDALIRYAIGLAPSLFAIMAINVYLYGGPLTFGYGTLFESYGFSALPVNVRNYGTWLVQTQTPLVLLASIPLFVRSALRGTGGVSARACLSGLIGLTFLSYAFYAPFDHWFYLRFLLPAYPALFVLLAAALFWIVAKLPIEGRLPVAAAIAIIIAGSGLKVARETGIFNSAAYERRHIRAAAALASHAPANAMVLAVQHSGSVRYYANRITLRYDWLKEDQLDAAVRDILAAGYQPFVVVDDWEAEEFRRRFSAAGRLGKLDWEPVARAAGQTEVRIYELK